MPSFWEHTRLDVLHVPGVATRVSTRSIAITCAPTSLAAPPPDIPAHARWIPPRALESPSARENPPRAEIIRAGGAWLRPSSCWSDKPRTVPKRRADRWERIFLVKTPFRSGENSSPVQSYDLERDPHLSG